MDSIDAWDDDSFEDMIARATIALYETDYSKDDVGRHWNQVANADIDRARKRGVFIPAPDRLIWEGGIDGIDGIPTVGCVSIGEDRRQDADDDRIESYCRLQYFRRIDRLPSIVKRPINGPAYESITLWPQDNGPMRASKTYLIVAADGAARLALPSWQSRDGDKDCMAAEISLHSAMQYVADARHQWLITADDGVSKVTLGAYADSVRSLLYARELPMTPTGRKRPILHLVHAHRRRIREGVDIDVREFLRGTREVVMDGTRYKVAAPQRLIEQMESGE
jgi:hypothetical protein